MSISDLSAPLASAFAGARAVVVGGLGFIGSSLARRLVALGAEVVAVDCRLDGSGANDANLREASPRLRLIDGDIRAADRLRPHLDGCDYVFNLAGQTSHQGSMTEPLLDLDLNGRAPLALLEACRAVNPRAAIVFASTRQIYGRPAYLPVDEKHPVRPVDVNGIDKVAGEEFHRLYHEVYGMRCCALRLTNTYGPRMRVKDARQMFLGLWVRLVLEARPFEVWGGEQLRDFTYVDDAVEAFLLAAASKATPGRSYNIGGDGQVSLRRLAELLIVANGGGRYELREFPPERKRIDIGDYYSDDTLFRAATGWRPRTALADGLAQTLAYYREHLSQYL